MTHLLEQNETTIIEERFRVVGSLLGTKFHAMEASLSGLNEEEALCMKFLFGSLPVSDLASCDGKLLLSFARDALRVRRETSWGSRIPNEIFLNNMLACRINDEPMEDCRSVFAAELLPRIAGKSMKQAALEVNLWCFEKASYESTDDRTVSPLTVMKNGRGRCGEESAFAVSAFRSVCIPARQCYAPKWSHCDDNHAWVEVWVDGTWYYLGACEPEPALDRGWFTYAATRAMLIHSIDFSPLTGSGEEPVRQNGLLTERNLLPAYADTAKLTVRVLGQDGKPAAGARVLFEVLNYAKLSPIADLTADRNGTVTLTTGRGDLFVHAVWGDEYRIQKVNVLPETCCTVDFSRPATTKESGTFDFAPPKGKLPPEIHEDTAQREKFQVRLKRAEKIREERTKTFYNAESARRYAKRFPCFQDEICDFLILSKGNYPEIEAFLKDTDLKARVALLRHLSKKDFTDLRAEVLEEHLNFAMKYHGIYPDEIWEACVLSPRIGKERLTPYRAPLISSFSEVERERFRRNPRQLAEFLTGRIRLCGERDYGSLVADPAGLLRLCAGSKLSRDTLFVAICRTFGIPARFSPLDEAPQFYFDGKWNRADGKEIAGSLLVLQSDGKGLHPGADYSLARLESGIFHTLHCPEIPEEGELRLPLSPGNYRILTANRQIDGTILSTYQNIGLKPNETVACRVSLRESDLPSRLKKMPLRELTLTGQNGTSASLHSLLAQSDQTILAVLDVKKEPTEHLLNELWEQRGFLNQKQILFLVLDGPALQDPLLGKVLSALPRARAFRCGREDFAGQLFSDLEAGDRRLPLSAVVDRNGNGRFAFSNYNVGTAAMLIQIASC